MSAWKSGSAEFGSVGSKYGAKTHSLSITEMPSHNHNGSTGTSPAYNETAIYSSGGGSNFVVHTWGGAYIGGDPTYQNKTIHSHSIPSQGGGGSHNNVQPTVAALLVIKT